MVAPDAEPVGGWAKLWHWLYYQGVSTVLLVLQTLMVGYFLYKGAPAAWDRHTAELKEARAEYSATNAAQRKELMERFKEQQEAFTRSIERLADRVGEPK